MGGVHLHLSTCQVNPAQGLTDSTWTRGFEAYRRLERYTLLSSTEISYGHDADRGDNLTSFDMRRRTAPPFTGRGQTKTSTWGRPADR